MKKELRLKWESYLQTKKDQTRVLVKRRWNDFFKNSVVETEESESEVAQSCPTLRPHGL